MPVTPTFPGIYIEEIHSSAHTIRAAPTSIAVFVGYSHPLKTKKFINSKEAGEIELVELFSFADYERNFGGFFNSSLFNLLTPSSAELARNYFGSLPHAVNQFFLNGGSVCYVAGLQAKQGSSDIAPGFVDIFDSSGVNGIRFTAREPTDDKHEMKVTIAPKKVETSSPPTSPPEPDVADITIEYSGLGGVVEVFRQVKLDDIKKITDKTAPFSNLVKISPPKGGAYPSFFTKDSKKLSNLTTSTTPISITSDFTSIFEADTPLDKVPIFNLMVLPGVTSNIVLSEALRFCETKRAFLIIDPPKHDIAMQQANWIGKYVDGGDDLDNLAPLAPNAAVYFPYIKSNDPVTGNPIDLPPAATVAGICARTDLNRGVWKAPAGLETTIIGTTGVVPGGQMSDMRQGTLNPKAVNCLRSFPGVGTVVFGARTTVGADDNTAQQQWKYVPVRRMALFLEQTLYNNLGWVVFEPNDFPLWNAIRGSIEAFMLGLFRQGAFQGKTPSDAFQVKCDEQTTTQADIDNGIVNIIVAFAPLKPAEFVIIKIAQIAGQTQTA